MTCTGYILFFFYFFIVNKQGCPTNCASCIANSEQCQQCTVGYWLQSKSCHPCPDRCAECINSAHCSKCAANYWGTNCFTICDEYCDDSGCDDESGYCNKCQQGFYGTHCRQNCELCKNNSCDLRNCKIGCIDGYYEFALEESKSCFKCHNHCALCERQAYCLKCDKGSYKFSYNNSGSLLAYCFKCQSNCEECTSYSACTTCKPGKYGTSCENMCNLQNCYKCVKSDGIEICIECETGYKRDGNICVQCEILNGECTTDCLAGFGGKTCNQTCFEGCADSQCDKVNGFCESCHRNNYGPACQHTCSINCAHDGSLVNICRKNNGSCTFGCKHGFRGEKCELAIITTSAKPESSTLTLGEEITNTTVKPGTTSSAKEITGITERVADNEQQRVIIAVGAGAGGGLLVVVALIIIVVCLVTRQRTQGSDLRDDENEQDSRQYPLTDTDSVYATPQKPRKEQSQDYIYAQPNKPKKSIHHNKKEIGVPQRAYDNIVIDLDNEGDRSVEINTDRITSGETDLEETDLDAILLENIDDEPKSIIVTEVQVPTSDTYYNMAGLIRSRIQISNLFEYVKHKTDFENEFEKLPKGLTRTCNEALKPHNRVKNRYNGIYAYDATRVVLRSGNFINANYVDDQSQSDISYIGSLGPTKIAMNNFATFWEMVCQENSNKIIMLTNLEESKKMKCEQYWPARGSQNTYGDFTVTFIAEKVFADFIVREFTLEQNSETRNITQYHYTAWPDKTVPHTASSLIEFRDKVEQGHTPVSGPMIVHCSAGIGRTGTYIALDILIREGKEENFVDIFGCVLGLRGQRVNMVQNDEQYMFLHLSVLYALTCEPDTLPIAAIPHFFTDEKIATQYQSLHNMRLLRSKGKRLILQAKSRKENRKGADIPDDEHRVRLTLTKHDYINAVYVNGYEETNKFVLAQTPLPNTVEDFVSMLYQERCSYIVSLDEENIKDKTVAQCIPPANKVSTFGHFQVSCTRSDPKEDFIFRELKISRIGSPPAKELTVRHYQFKGWNISDTVPKTISSFLNLIQEVEKARKSSHSEQPIVVHCLTRSERSGLFCVVCILMEKMAVEKELSVLNTVCQVRSRRRSAVKDLEQLQFCYNCVEEMLEMPDTNTYYNISNV